MITLRSIPAPQEVEAVIDEEGFVNLPYIGHIRASGMTSSELEQAIQRAYIEGDIYKQVTVNVVIAAQSYYVRGEVKKPGRYPIVSGVTLVRAIAAAAGFTDFANPKKITLIRGDNNRLYNYWDMEDKPEKDVGIEAGDVIVVPRGFL
jgi:polysaccharide export outer membrane protein